MDKYIKISILIFIISLITVVSFILTSKEKYKNIELLYNKIKLENTIESYKIDIKNDKTKYYKDLVKTFPNDKTYKDMLNNTPIYIINLDRSKDRHKFMKDQMNDYKITNYKFISAVDGKKIKKRENNMYDYEDISFLNNDDTVTNGELGCTLSHLKAISEVLKNNNDYAIICEDDADLFWVRTWDRTIKNIVDDAPEDWEWISLYLSKPKMYDQESFYIDFFENDLYSTTFYIINRNGCQKIMEKYFLDNKFILDKNIIQSHKWKSHRKTRYVVADAYLPFMVNSYGIHIGFITGFNDNVSMNSTIHSGHTDFHVKCNTQNQENLTKKFLRRKEYHVPKIIHIILISEDDKLKYKPTKKYTDYKIKIWTSKEINKLNMKNRNEYDNISEIYGKKIIALYEILYQFGGFYFNDNKYEMLNEKMPNMMNVSKTNDGLITMDFIAVVKGHPFMKVIIDKLSEHYQRYYSQELDISIGNKYLTRMFQMLQNNEDDSPPGIKINV